MKKLFKIILGATVGSTLLLSSCNFLDVDPYFEATFKEDSIFHSKKNAEGYLWNTPKGFPDAGAIWGNSWNPGESASDEITLKYQTNEFWGLQFSVGTINSRNLPIQNQWYDMYVIVARCNKMLKEVYNVPDMNEMDRRRYIGYVHFMRGYAYYHLLMNWGPLIIVGDEELSTSEPAEYYNRERATYDESVDYICDEFRLATQGIYSADEQSVNYYQRPTKGAAMALIARLRLFQASPLFNGGAAARKCFGTWKRKSDGAYYVNQEYDPRRWAVAAAAAKQLTKMDTSYIQWKQMPRTHILWPPMSLLLTSLTEQAISILITLTPTCSQEKVSYRLIKNSSGRWNPVTSLTIPITHSLSSLADGVQCLCRRG